MKYSFFATKGNIQAAVDGIDKRNNSRDVGPSKNNGERNKTSLCKTVGGGSGGGHRGPLFFLSPEPPTGRWDNMDNERYRVTRNDAE